MTEITAGNPAPPAPGRRLARLDEFVSRPGRLWLAFFLYAAVVAALVQLVVLPYILPHLHDGHGLLIEGDWVRHHLFTAEIAKRIREEGWSVWQLRPQGEHALHGIPSAIYALVAPEPWTLIPIHAALHATSTLLLVYILHVFVASWGVAVAASLCFLLFPSALITYTQITKDSYSICGGFMFLYGWLLLARWPEGQSRRQAIKIAALIAGGATLAWVARPYLVQIMTGVSAGFAIMLAVRMIVLSLRSRLPLLRGVLASVMAGLMVAMLLPFNAIGADMYLTDAQPTPAPTLPSAARTDAPQLWADWLTELFESWLLIQGAPELPVVESPFAAAAAADAIAARRPGGPTNRPGELARRLDEAVRRLSGAAPDPGESVPGPGEVARRAGEAARLPGEAVPGPGEVARQSGEAARRPGRAARRPAEPVPPPRSAGTSPVPPATPARAVRPTAPWTSPRWVPSAIDNRMYSLVLLRNRWKDTEGRSTVDQDVMPANLQEIAAYLPRLMAVGFLAPFPAQWVEDGAFASTTLMRRVVGVEMLLTYVALLGLLLNGWRWRARLECWFVLAYGGGFTLIWAFIVPNVGSLHRARFGFLMVLVALGIAGILSSRPMARWRAFVAAL